MNEIKDFRQIDFLEQGDAFIIIDYGPKIQEKSKKREVEIMYYDTKMKKKLIFSTACKTCNPISKKFIKDIVKALNTIEFME